MTIADLVSKPELGHQDKTTEPPSHVVAIGASAGGLEPIELLFDQLPESSGAAFVLIQHLSPDFKSLMDQLLARHTSMQIVRVTDRTRIARDRVYLIPPRKEMVVADGELLLRDRDAEAQRNLPIDVFLKTLAEEVGERAVAVILSGSGSDGAKGCRAIAEAGGIVIAQAPTTAAFASMPQAVVEEVGGALTAAPSEIAALIARHVLGDTPSNEAGRDMLRMLDPTKRILVALRQRFGPDFGYYKQSTVLRRIERRVGLTQSASLETYANLVAHNPSELETLYHDLLIGVTGFFRDEGAFAAFEQEALPGLLDRMEAGEQLRIWVAGAATGEEVYSLAMLIAEGAERRHLPINMKIFATDIHEHSLAVASEGAYSLERLRGVSTRRLKHFFEECGDERFRVKQALRRFIVFSRHNIIKDPPFSRLHLISCRNLLIYLGEAAQRKVLSLFHFSLRKNGVLFLGSSETPGRLADEFTTVHGRYRLFKKQREVRLPSSLDLLPPSTDLPQREPRLKKRNGAHAASDSASDFRQLMPAYESLLRRFIPAGLLVDQAGEIVHIFGDASAFLRPLDEGAVSVRATERVKDALQPAVTGGIDRALRRGLGSSATDITLNADDAEPLRTTVTVEPITTDRNQEPTHAFVSFDTGACDPASLPEPNSETALLAPEDAARRIRELESDLRVTEESLQTTIEELETSNEELQSSNEELQSSNEELQSTNEELFSINEELHTVSGEYEHRIEELVQLNSDMNNLLTSTDIGAIFLDRDLNLRRFTPAAGKLFHLVPHDVGRPITHVTSRLVSTDLQEDIAKIQAGQPRIEREVTTDAGDHYLIRLLPYTTADGTPDGVSLSFVDIGELKRTYAQLERRNDELAEANEELERFAYIASHDLKAPVRGCSHVLTFLREDLAPSLSEAQTEEFDTAISRLRQMETMLRELLDYARLHHEEPSIETIDVDELLRHTVAFLEPPDGFDIQLSGPFPEIRHAPGLMSLVFRNLIGNAIKHHHKTNGVIVVRGEREGNRAEFFVSDDGPGIDQAMHEQVFEPFRKLNPSQPGTGMGLAFVKRAVERAQGTIEIIASGRGRGSTFRVTLPVEMPSSGCDVDQLQARAAALSTAAAKAETLSQSV